MKKKVKRGKSKRNKAYLKKLRVSWSRRAHKSNKREVSRYK